MIAARYRNYAFLIPLVVLALSYQIAYAVTGLWVTWHQTELAKPFFVRDPVGSVVYRSPSAARAGVQIGDKSITVDGRPDKSETVFLDALKRHRPGDAIDLTMRSKAGGKPRHLRVTLEAEGPSRATAGDWTVMVLISVMLLVAVSIGSYVVLRLPSDPTAIWLFGLLIGLGHFIHVSSLSFWPEWALIVGSVYANFMQTTFGIWMMLFGIYFPERSLLDVRRPWLKWLVICPLAVFALLEAAATALHFESFQAAGAVQAWLPFGKLIAAITVMAQATFFFAIARKMNTAKSRDAKRRLRILYFGATISLTPLLLLLLYVFGVKGGDFSAAPQDAVVPVALFMLLLPATLAYVVLVERATDLRVVVRQGLTYATARTGLRVLAAVVIGGLIWAASDVISSTALPVAIKICLIAGASMLIAISLRRASINAAAWLDRRFFREAYHAELILSELNDTIQTMIDEARLLDTVGARISESLHVPAISILLNSQGWLRPAYEVGLSGVASIVLEEHSYVVNKVRFTPDLGQIYLDVPQNWVFGAPDGEVETIRNLRTQLLLPIVMRDRLLGLLSLGPKRSEEPYSKSDVSLLKSIAFQMGLALENSRLASAVALETAQREKLNREIEIAHEVQERLFPHELPMVAGLDYSGACRPALGVGGDYYDFLQLGDGKLGIAVGDVSGKGIAAALLMASLQASLRGQVLHNTNDLTTVISRVNRLVYDASATNRYATFFYAQYESATGKLTYVNAGHNPPMVLRERDGIIHVIRLETGGMVIGLFREAPYQQATLTIEPGDIFVGFTDGISEAMNHGEEEWGEERMLPALAACALQSAGEMIPSVMAAADQFTDGAPQHDDMTLVVMKFGLAA